MIIESKACNCGDCDAWCREYYKYGSDNYFAQKGVHIMNKNERRALNKLKKSTGLSEEEIRKIKQYRIILSNAQKSSTIKKK